MTKSNRVTFAQFNAVLNELGFAKKVMPGEGVGYEHRPTGSMLFVRPHKANELVPLYVLAAARGQLDRQGIVDADQFEEMLQTAAA